MKRKTRYWFCENCGNVYRRLKREKEMRCRRCGGKCRKARKWPAQANAKRRRWSRKGERGRQDRADLHKRYSKMRTAYGSVLQISKETRAAWRKFLIAKQRRTFESRGQDFLEALAVDLWSCPHYRGRTERDCNCSGGGLAGTPKLSIDDSIGCLGSYGRGFRRARDGHEYAFYIKVRWKQRCRPSTFLHEAVHWADDLGRIEKHYGIGMHSGPFYKRLNDLAKRLRFTLEDVDVD